MQPEFPNSEKIFYGHVKSAGKCFGFLSCAETQQIYGVDIFVDRKRFEGDWEAEFVGGSGGGRQYQKRRPGGRLPPAGEAGFDSTCGVAPWDAVQD